MTDQGEKKPKKLYKISRIKAVFLCLLIAVLFTSTGYWIGSARKIQWTSQIVKAIHSIRENNQTYHFIYPLLTFDFSSIKQFLEDNKLHKRLQNYIDSQYQSNNADSISVVFRNLPDGSRVNINETVAYHPGSMLKVLIMMAYFREAETDPNILSKTLLYSQNTDSETKSIAYGQPTNLTVGQNYVITDLLQNMIKNSDNGAEQLLIDNVNDKILNQAYVDLGVPSPDQVSGEYTISAGQYSGFLRILYNSTYLTEVYSEQALSMMSQSSYKDGITAGVPGGTEVAQKYGERVDLDSSGKNVTAIELHDCGIVYAKDHPYLLCVMTKGTDIAKLTSIIKDISSQIYNYVSSGGK